MTTKKQTDTNAPCTACDGSGLSTVSGRTCGACHGTGVEPTLELQYQSVKTVKAASSAQENYKQQFEPAQSTPHEMRRIADSFDDLGRPDLARDSRIVADALEKRTDPKQTDKLENLSSSDQAQLEHLRQQLADIEHQRWSHWQRYIHGLMGRKQDGWYVLDPEYVKRWERQIATPYEQLSEREQASDMEQVDRYWSLVEKALAQAKCDGAREALEKLPTSIEINRSALYKVPVPSPDASDNDVLYVAGVPLSAIDQALAQLNEEEESNE